MEPLKLSGRMVTVRGGECDLTAARLRMDELEQAARDAELKAHRASIDAELFPWADEDACWDYLTGLHLDARRAWEQLNKQRRAYERAGCLSRQRG